MFKWLRRKSLSRLLEDYLEQHHARATTKTLTRQAWSQVVTMVGDMDIRRFTPAIAEKVQSTWQQKFPTSNTARIYRKMVSPVWSWALKQGYVKRNPFAEIRVPKASKKQVRVFNQHEFRQLIDACQNTTDPLRWVTMLAIARTTALRKSAIQNLTRQEICFETETINIKEKADSETTWPWLTKDREEQTLPLVEPVSRLLLELLYRISTNQPYLFLKPARYYHLLECKQLGILTDDMMLYPISNFDRTFRKIKRRAGVKGRFHDLRSTCLTGLADVLNPNELRTFAAHSDIETTMKYIGCGDVVNKARPVVNQALVTALTPSQALYQTELRPD